MTFDENFIVLCSFIGFIGLIMYFRVPRKVIAALDNRAKEIAAEIEEARRLREEAQQILASYQRKQREAEREVEDIVSQAREEAERLARETHEALEQRLERRAKLAEEKIGQAEADATRDVQNRAIDIAIEASRALLTKYMNENQQKALVDSAIGELNAKLH